MQAQRLQGLRLQGLSLPALHFPVPSRSGDNHQTVMQTCLNGEHDEEIGISPPDFPQKAADIPPEADGTADQMANTPLQRQAEVSRA